MRTRALRAALVIAVMALAGTADIDAQRATEMFIPIGQSPGVSNTISIIGTIRVVDPRTQTLEVVADSGNWTVPIESGTRIWLDTSKVGLPPRKGTFADFSEGLLVEFKFDAAGNNVEWIKVQIQKAGRAR